MSSFLKRFATDWHDAGRDMVLIVASILIAFALDAWWQGLGTRSLQSEQVEALQSEMEVGRATLDGYAASLERAEWSTSRVLEVMSPTARGVDPDSLLYYLGGSFNIGFSEPRHATLDEVLANTNPLIGGHESLPSQLERWSRSISDIATDTEHLERNRDVDLQAALIEAGMPGIAPASAIPLGLPPTSFPVDADAVSRNRRVYAGLYYRAMRIRLLSQYVADLIALTDEILAELGRI